MKAVMKMILIGSMLAISGIANAGFVQTGLGKINYLSLCGSGDLYVGTTASRINPAGCPFAAYQIAASNVHFNKYYAFLLAAKANEQNVRFRIDNADCNGNNPKLVFMETL